MYETFVKLRTGIETMHLHGNMNQERRLDIFHTFSTADHGKDFIIVQA